MINSSSSSTASQNTEVSGINQFPFFNVNKIRQYEPLRVSITEGGLEPICLQGEEYYDWIDRAAERLGVHGEDLVEYVLSTISKCTPTPNTSTINAILASIIEAEPKDPQELMLLCQMAVVNNMAIDALSDSLDTSSLEYKETQLRIACKLMNLYSRQMETLHKYRKQILSPMQVINSGNAVIGNVYQNKNN